MDKKGFISLISLLLWPLSLLMAQTTITMPQNGSASYKLSPCVEYTVLDPGEYGNYPSNCDATIFLYSPNGEPIIVTGTYSLGTGIYEGHNYMESLGIYHGNQIMSVESNVPNYYGEYYNYGTINLTCSDGYIAIRFMSFRTNGASGFELKVRVQSLGTSVVHDVQVNSLSSSSATLSWQDINHGPWTIRYGKSQNNLNHTLTSNSRSAVLTDLDAGTVYYYKISNNNRDPNGMAGECESPTGSFVTQAPRSPGNCINFTDLNSPYVQCYHGNYADPKVKRGRLDYGASNINSRHTVVRDRQRDPRTTGLSTIPEGESASVRLGNWDIGAQSECISYQYTVDTNQKDLLILKYAVVLEDPDHVYANQPLFALTITDSTGMEINPTCYSARFVPGSNTATSDWHTGTTETVRWKDWTTIGIDLAPLHGKTIFVNLTTRDCLQAGHYGYAYFVLNCARKKMDIASCGYNVNNTFTVPDGFKYQWYKENNPSNILGNKRTLNVNSSGIYVCRLSYATAQSNSNTCCFTMRVTAGPRFPYAGFTMDSVGRSGCNVRYHFTNQSFISSDEAHNNRIGDEIESFKWIIDGATVSNSQHPDIDFSEGWHTVSLVSMLGNNNNCTDQKTVRFYVHGHCPVYDTMVYDFCERINPVRFFDRTLTAAGTYTRDSANHHWVAIINLYHKTYGTYHDTVVENSFAGHRFHGARFSRDVTDTVFRLTNVHGCDSLLSYSLYVCRNRDTTLQQSVCDNVFPYRWNSLNFTTEGSKQITIARRCGSDSLIRMTVYALPTYAIDYYDTICDNQNTTRSGLVFVDNGVHTIRLQSMDGCDSNELLHLKVYPTYNNYDYQSICDGDTLFWIDGLYHCAVEYPAPHILQNTLYGCDSLTTLNLTVRANSGSVRHDTVSENSLSGFRFNGIRFVSDVHDTVLHLTNAVGCDSAITYSLYVCRNVDTTLARAVCDNMFPLVWYDGTFDDADTQHFEYLRFCGGDSTVTLQITALPTYMNRYDDTICDNQESIRSGHSFSTAGIHDIMLRTIDDCDSLELLNLVVFPTYNDTDRQSICRYDTLMWIDGNAYTDVESPMPSLLFKSRHHCDSIIRLSLKVNEHSSYSFFDTVPENTIPTYFFNGVHFSDDIRDTLFVLVNAVGCDSLLTYSLYICRNRDTIAERVVCDNLFPYQWHDAIFYSADTQRYERLRYCGGDSNIELRLTTYPTYLNHFYDSVCRGQYAYQSGNAFHSDGDHDVVFRTINDCDSVERLHLTVFPTYDDTDYFRLCWYDSLLWIDGSFYYEEPLTMPRIHFYSSRGCDSLRTLNLNFLPRIEANMYPDPAYPTWDNPNVTFIDNSLMPHKSYWYIDGQLVDSTAQIEYSFPSAESEVTVMLVARDGYGCSETIRKTLSIRRENLYVPNLFTPTRIDNNVMWIKGENILWLECYVYDRRGQFIFKFNSIDDVWDGTKDGQLLPQATYTYVIRYRSIHHPKSILKKFGTITLVR